MKAPARAIAKLQLILYPTADLLCAAAARQTRRSAGPHFEWFLDWESVGREKIPDTLPYEIVFYHASFTALGQCLLHRSPFLKIS